MLFKENVSNNAERCNIEKFQFSLYFTPISSFTSRACSKFHAHFQNTFLHGHTWMYTPTYLSILFNTVWNRQFQKLYVLLLLLDTCLQNNNYVLLNQ